MKIFCVGRNYVDHIDELANERPDEPLLFIKPETAKLRKNEAFYIPEFTDNVHYEVELLVKIKKVGKYIQPKFAHKYYQEIGLGIDFTARDLQDRLKEKGLPWEKAKAFDGAALIGSKWLQKNEVGGVGNLKFSLKKNGKKVQQGNTALMIWNIGELIAEISHYFTLKIGDVIFTGTPAGVGRVDRDDCLEGFIKGQSIFKTKVR